MSARRTGAAAGLLATALIALAGCGGGGGGDAAELPDAAMAPPAAAAPIAVEAVPHGGAVTAGPTTPKPVARALKGSGVVVVAFVVGNTADDDDVAAAVAEVRKDPDASRGVAFFTYRVGKDRFGDLADRLGVTGSPSVAVIGRDRTLVNLWTGLVDAQMLRQSISDAADTAAANPGKAAVSGTPGAATAVKGPAGSPEGIALIKGVNASYADVPGIRVSGEFSAGSTSMTIDSVVLLAGGKVTATTGTFTFGDQTVEVTGDATAGRARLKGASCWADAPRGEFSIEDTPLPTVALAGAKVGAPRVEGDDTLLDVTKDGQTLTFVIDTADSTVREMRSSVGTITFETLDAAPEIDPGTPVCDNPADALGGLAG